MKIIRRPALKESGILDYLLMYVLATVVGALAGALLALRVGADVYTESNAPSIEVATEWSRQSTWVCILAGVLIACSYVTYELVSDKLSKRRAVREKQEREKNKARLRSKWEEKFGPRK